MRNRNQVHAGADWLADTDVERMLRRARMSVRKRRLFACACCRRVWSLLPDEARRVLEIAEGMIDWAVSKAEQGAAWGVILEHVRSATPMAVRAVFSAKVGGCGGASAAAARATGDAGLRSYAEERAWQANLLREMVCNPFRAVPLSPCWLTPEVAAFARSIEREQGFHRVSELGELLARAGYDQPDILDHWRSPREHVRGCWVVDLLCGLD